MNDSSRKLEKDSNKIKSLPITVVESEAGATPTGVRGGPCAPVGVATPSEQPPVSNTGAEITVHWLRGGLEKPINEVLDMVSELTEGGYSESHDWGRMMYRKHHSFVGGLTVYEQPVAENMSPVMIDAPGAACEFLGLDNLRTMFEDAELSRSDIAFDHAPFTPAELAQHVRDGDIRCRAKSYKFMESLTGTGDTLYIGSRSSEQYLRAYNSRGFTRVELELKGEAARGFKAVLLASDEAFAPACVGVLRAYVDFVDASSSTNVSRRTLLPAWETFTEGLEKVFIRVTGSIKPTVDGVVKYIEHQVAATLYVYEQLGYDIKDLLRLGKHRLRSRHKSVMAFAGVT